MTLGHLKVWIFCSETCHCQMFIWVLKHKDTNQTVNITFLTLEIMCNRIKTQQSNNIKQKKYRNFKSRVGNKSKISVWFSCSNDKITDPHSASGFTKTLRMSHSHHDSCERMGVCYRILPEGEDQCSIIRVIWRGGINAALSVQYIWRAKAEMHQGDQTADQTNPLPENTETHCFILHSDFSMFLSWWDFSKSAECFQQEGTVDPKSILPV